MKKILIIALLFLILPFFVKAQSLGRKLSGRILLDVERNGEAWYIYPSNNRRYYLGLPSDAFNIMRELGLGITEADFQKIAQAGMPVDGDLDIAQRLAGKIVLQVEKNGEAWYINPVDLKKYYLGRPSDAFSIMRELGLGIAKKDLALIHKNGYDETINEYSKYEHKTILTVDGEFTIDIVEINLSNPNLKIITETADNYNCKDNCQVKPLVEYVVANEGFVGINGTYFDAYNGNRNYYFFPVYNSNLEKMINEDQLKYWTTGPIFAFDENNKFYYFKDSRDFKSVADFESNFSVKLQAAIGNKPRLIENGMNALIDWELDEKQKTVKASRNAIAYKEEMVYLVVAYNATVPNLANIMKAMDIEYALNLDGGYSSALFYNDEYMVGPGRDVPNAILFSQ